MRIEFEIVGPQETTKPYYEAEAPLSVLAVRSEWNSALVDGQFTIKIDDANRRIAVVPGNGTVYLAGHEPLTPGQPLYLSPHQVFHTVRSNQPEVAVKVVAIAWGPRRVETVASQEPSEPKQVRDVRIEEPVTPSEPRRPAEVAPQRPVPGRRNWKLLTAVAVTVVAALGAIALKKLLEGNQPPPSTTNQTAPPQPSASPPVVPSALPADPAQPQPAPTATGAAPENVIIAHPVATPPTRRVTTAQPPERRTTIARPPTRDGK